jgi:hypothetical protein
MKKLTLLVLTTALLGSAGLLRGAGERPFNGNDLTGWKARAQDTTKSQWKVGTAKVSAADPKLLTVSPGGHELINDTQGHGQSLDL